MNHASVFLPHKIVQDTAGDLSRFGDEVISKKILDWVSDAERNVPYVKGGVPISRFSSLHPSLSDSGKQGPEEMLSVEGQMSLSRVKGGGTSRRWV
jgi:hypothetical protein